MNLVSCFPSRGLLFLIEDIVCEIDIDSSFFSIRIDRNEKAAPDNKYSAENSFGIELNKIPTNEPKAIIMDKILSVRIILCAQQDLNLRPRDYESPALTAELWAQRYYSLINTPFTVLP